MEAVSISDAHTAIGCTQRRRQYDRLVRSWIHECAELPRFRVPPELSTLPRLPYIDKVILIFFERTNPIKQTLPLIPMRYTIAARSHVIFLQVSATDHPIIFAV
jgi:hypothetical protein